MRTARNQNLTALASLSAKPRPNNRRHGRIRCELLVCGLGQVLDISASGMRVAHHGWLDLRMGEVITLRLSVLHLTQWVQAKVVRYRRTGLRRHEVGFEFVNVSPEISAGC